MTLQHGFACGTQNGAYSEQLHTDITNHYKDVSYCYNGTLNDTDGTTTQGLSQMRQHCTLFRLTVVLQFTESLLANSMIENNT